MPSAEALQVRAGASGRERPRNVYRWSMEVTERMGGGGFDCFKRAITVEYLSLHFFSLGAEGGSGKEMGEIS